MTSKLSFLTSVAAGAMVLGMAATPASAFDKLNWEWNLKVDEKVTKNVKIDVDVDPSGLVLLENVQVQVGDVKAESIVTGIDNNQYDANGGSTIVDLGTLGFTGTYNGNGVVSPSSFTPQGGPADFNPTFMSGTVSGGGTLPIVGGGGLTTNYDLGSIEVTVDPTGTFDARTELPEVISAATAVGNNSSIDSEVMVEVHEGQFLFDTVDGGVEAGLPEGLAALAIYELFDDNYGDINTNHLVGAATLVGAVGGLIDKAEISAVSRVSNILNASVDSAATAVGNNKSINIEPRTFADAVMMGDVTQVSVANVSALSDVRNVSLNNYTNLGKIGGPVVNSVATAVGNNLSVSVKAPVVD
ncbi:hypothetical protein ABIE65_003478 [Constrictibacter sp. MBR-5]|jgi:hypothetical protein|uniref:hypothetical protein n=1 Tax=Constrictibacter sp. MBR-5 TaxID=3156467 RepID=UPI00339982CF